MDRQEAEQRHDEMMNMVRRIEAAGWAINFSFHSVDAYWSIWFGDDEFRGPATLAHAYLSGLVVACEARREER